MAATIAVTIPSGAMAKMMLSAHPIDWLMNCIVTRSPKSASKLMGIVLGACCLYKYLRGTHGARSENRLFEKSSPSSAARHPVRNVARKSQRATEGMRLVILPGVKESKVVEIETMRLMRSGMFVFRLKSLLQDESLQDWKVAGVHCGESLMCSRGPADDIEAIMLLESTRDATPL